MGLDLKNVEALVTYDREVHPTIEAYLESVFPWRPEFQEMTDDDRQEFKKECLSALKPFLSDEGLASEIEVIFYSGYKASS